MRLSRIVLCVSLLAVPLLAQDEWQTVAKALGREGQLTGDVYKVSFPRTDLHVRMGNTDVEPGAALGSWMAFRKLENRTIVDGDLVLLPSEIDAVVKELQAEGLEVTGIHNHLAGEEPQIMYVQI